MDGGILGGAVAPVQIVAGVLFLVVLLLFVTYGMTTGWTFKRDGAVNVAWANLDETTGVSQAQKVFADNNKDGKKVWPASVTTSMKPATSGFAPNKFPQVYERSDGNGFTKERLVETRSLAPQWVPSEWSVSDRGDNDKAALQGNTIVDNFANAKKAGVDQTLLAALHGN